MASRQDLQKALHKIRQGWKAKILAPLAATQALETKDKEAKGPIWVSRTIIEPCPENDVPQLLFKAIQELAGDGQEIQHDAPQADRIRAEWLGPRSGAVKGAAEPVLSEKQKYDALCEEVGDSSPVIFYLHGGNMVFGDPVSIRSSLQRLTKAAKARSFAVAYRLAPKHIFPTALLDVLVAYMSLLSPPPGSHHAPIPANKIVLVADSVGCGLALALIQFILHVQRLEIQVKPMFHGRPVQLDLPAGFAGHSGYCDMTVAMPSERTMASKDMFLETLINPVNWALHDEPSLNWPSHPPRHDFACYQNALDHPLLSPLAVNNWEGAPPMWIAMGDERPLDSMRVIAQRAHQVGVNVAFEWYKEMPHNWVWILPQFQSSQKALKRWAAAINSIAEGRFEGTSLSITAWTLEETPLDITSLSPLPLEDIAPMMRMEKLNRLPIRGSSGSPGSSKL